MKKIIFVFFLFSIICGCATYKDSYGKPAPKDVIFDCDQKCGAYDMNSSPIMAGYCAAKCMESRGYTQQR